MKNDLISTLRSSAVLAPLEANELKQVLAASRRQELAAEEMLFAHGQQDPYFYILEKGRIALQLRMRLGKRCGGEARFVLQQPGQTLGWSALVRVERISTSARILEPASLVAVDLRRLTQWELALKVRRRLVQQLYGLLQEAGICPPDLQAVLAFGLSA